MESNDRKADFFIDGQNLFLTVKRLYGYQHPNFDVLKLCTSIAEKKGWEVGTIRFYTGMPGQVESPHWHDYWARRLADLGKNGVQIFNPPLRYRTSKESFPDGTWRNVTHATEKGVDVRIALDIVKSAIAGRSALVLLSQDNDMSVAVEEAHSVAKAAGRKLEVACAYPTSDFRSGRGVEGTSWIPMSKDFYDLNIDARDFRSDGMRRSHERQIERQIRHAALSDERMIQGRHDRHTHEGHTSHGDFERMRLAEAASKSIPPLQHTDPDCARQSKIRHP